MARYSLLGVFREKRFSPGMVEKDAAVLRGVLDRVKETNLPLEIQVIEGERLREFAGQPDFILTMAQSEDSLKKLQQWEKASKIVNSVKGVRNCYREFLVRLLSEANVPFPHTEVVHLRDLESAERGPFRFPFWLKRGDVHAMAKGDVVFITSERDLKEAIRNFRLRGIEKLAVQEHVSGKVYKFYGVGKCDFFRVYDEGSEHKDTTVPWVESLRGCAITAAEALGLEIFGGDAVVDKSGRLSIIDLNDWPSFSLCCEEASEAIFQHIVNKWQLI